MDGQRHINITTEPFPVSEAVESVYIVFLRVFPVLIDDYGLYGSLSVENREGRDWW